MCTVVLSAGFAKVIEIACGNGMTRPAGAGQYTPPAPSGVVNFRCRRWRPNGPLSDSDTNTSDHCRQQDIISRHRLPVRHCKSSRRCRYPVTAQHIITCSAGQRIVAKITTVYRSQRSSIVSSGSRSDHWRCCLQCCPMLIELVMARR